MNVAVIIPARGGSKGIPKKNIIDFCGKPLVAWSILQAKNSKGINSVFVSSDSREILAVAHNYGAIPIKRPNEISGDTASSESTIEHAIKVMDIQPDIIVMLQPTSPLRKPDDLSKAINQFRDDKVDSLFSGSVLEDFLIWEKDGKGKFNSFNYDYRSRGRRQDRHPQFVENGSFYMFKSEIVKKGNRLGGKIGVYLMDFWQSFEIDNPEDLELVKILFNLKLEHLYATIRE